MEKIRKNIFTRTGVSFIFVIAVGVIIGVVSAQSNPLVIPGMGTASDFAVLSAAPGGGGAVTCTTSGVNGDVGSTGGTAAVVQTSCTIAGDIVAPVLPQVVADFNTAYGEFAGLGCTSYLDSAYTGVTMTLAPGVYCNSAAVTFTGTTLILDAHGDANAVWVFKIGTGGTGALTGTNLLMTMAGGGQPCNVYWWVAQAVTMTTSGFKGTILAGAAVTITGVAGTTTPINGDLLATGAVTLTDVNVTSCDATGGGGGGGGDTHKKCHHRKGHKHDQFCHKKRGHDKDCHKKHGHHQNHRRDG